MNLILNLLHTTGLDFVRTCSVLGKDLRMHNLYFMFSQSSAKSRSNYPSFSLSQSISLFLFLSIFLLYLSLSLSLSLFISLFLCVSLSSSLISPLSGVSHSLLSFLPSFFSLSHFNSFSVFSLIKYLIFL